MFLLRHGASFTDAFGCCDAITSQPSRGPTFNEATGASNHLDCFAINGAELVNTLKMKVEQHLLRSLPLPAMEREGPVNENDDTISTHTGGYSPCSCGNTPPPPPPIYHNHGGDHPFHRGSFTDFLPPDLRAMGADKPARGRDSRVVDVGGGADVGLCLTWKDLSVFGNDGSRAILESSDGYAEPGQVLAIIGPSGSGKTTLLNALAGRLASNTRRSGEILINGRKQALAFGTSAYVTQDDLLLATLTVWETVHYSAELQLPSTMSMRERAERAEATIRQMGLHDAMNTRVGNISGGQKRRLSICLEILTRPRLLFMDEPTSGLDSAASFHVMSRIIRITTSTARTLVVSIHQPSAEVFDLFHNLCLLSSGHTVYFGPTPNAVDFFAINGFRCPVLKNPADHYLRTINKDFDQGEEEHHHSSAHNTAEAISILVRSYNSSDHHLLVQKRVSELSSTKGAKLRRGRGACFLWQCVVLTRRSAVNMSRDMGYYWLRFGIYLAIGFALGTIFYSLGNEYSAILDRASVIMFVAGFMTFMTIGGFPSFVEDMKIFARERMNGHYGVAAYVISHTLSSAPFLALVSVIPAAIAYFPAGLQRTWEHFCYFTLVLYLCMFLVESLMMLVASLVPDFLMGIILGAGVQGLMMLTGGFFRLPPDIPRPVWKYPCYYISLHKYAFQGLNKNEFIGLVFRNKDGYFPPIVSGEYLLRDTFQLEVGYSKWVDLGILVGMLVVYRVLFFVFIKLAEKLRPVMTTVRGKKKPL